MPERVCDPSLQGSLLPKQGEKGLNGSHRRILVNPIPFQFVYSIFCTVSLVEYSIKLHATFLGQFLWLRFLAVMPLPFHG